MNEWCKKWVNELCPEYSSLIKVLIYGTAPLCTAPSLLLAGCATSSTTAKPQKRPIKRPIVICSKLTARTTNQATDQILLSIPFIIPHTAHRSREWPFFWVTDWSFSLTSWPQNHRYSYTLSDWSSGGRYAVNTLKRPTWSLKECHSSNRFAVSDIIKMLDRTFRSGALLVARRVHFAQKTTGCFIGRSCGRTTY